jgi:glycosyltransferase involved in cell wall biosynthesis
MPARFSSSAPPHRDLGADRSLSPRVSVVGILPGPINGMTLVTRRVVDALAATMPIRIFDLAHPRWKHGRLWRIARIARSIAALPRILSWPRLEGDIFYTPVNSGSGLWLNLLHVRAARRRGYRCVLHHHTYAYLDHPDPRMHRLVQATSFRDLHILLCARMQKRFQEIYQPRAGTALLPSSVVSLPSASPRTHLEMPFCLGHLANLSEAKGLNAVGRLMDHLLDRNVRVKLLLAGPPSTRRARATLGRMIETYGEHLDYRGPLTGEEAKTSYFRELHAFLFPTIYAPESWGIVINEAMASAVPVLTYGRGCIPDLVTEGSGLVVPVNQDFLQPAAGKIEEWIDNPSIWLAASEAALVRGRQLGESAEEALDHLVESFSGADSRNHPRPG